MSRRIFSPNIAAYRIASSSGTLQARVITPTINSLLPPLVVLHGISRNARDLVDFFKPEADRSGRTIVVPHFTEKAWPCFQRPSRNARPDQALLALLTHLALLDPAFEGPVDLFGHSGGAQLAHRFAMLYPQKVGTLSLAAAGWYCLPDASMDYPYGLGADATPGAQMWARWHDRAIPTYLRLAVRVFVGTQDIERDASLRQNPDLDRIQGRTRLARAESYVDRFRAAALARGIVPDIALTRMPGVVHDVAQAVERADLARRVTEAEPATLAAAS
jgi:pimeloyl-ACP methyl ester carboxylesterase